MPRKSENPSSYEDCLNSALRILQRAAQTEKKMQEKLIGRKFELETVDKVLQKLKNMKFVDDEKYARDYVSYRGRTNPLGKFNLRFKLMQKGIEKNLAKDAVDEISPEEELELARKLTEKRLRALARFEPSEQKQKLARFLAARGFSSNVVFKVINEL